MRGEHDEVGVEVGCEPHDLRGWVAHRGVDLDARRVAVRVARAESVALLVGEGLELGVVDTGELGRLEIVRWLHVRDVRLGDEDDVHHVGALTHGEIERVLEDHGAALVQVDAGEDDRGLGLQDALLLAPSCSTQDAASSRTADGSAVISVGDGGKVSEAPKVGVIMGSRSDLPTMQPAIDVLTELGVPHEVRIVSAHRTPDWMFEYAEQAEARGLEVIIAAAGGAAHLPGMVAAKSLLPVLGVPVAATGLVGVDALLSIVQMPKGVPVGTLAIGQPGAANAALLAARICANHDPTLRERLRAWRDARRDEVLAQRYVSGGEAS
jgi:5-(carboxyamino)imidazole ribonucleotide mutase